MAIPLSTIKTQIHDWVTTASGFDGSNVIWAHQNAPEPSGPYIVINPVTQIVRSGMFDEVGEINDDGEVVTYSYRHVHGTINCYGTGAILTMSTIQDELDRPLVYQNFADNQLAVQVGSIKDLTTMKGRLFEERAFMPFTVFCHNDQDVSDDLGWFNQIEVGSEDLNIPDTIISNS